MKQTLETLVSNSFVLSLYNTVIRMCVYTRVEYVGA